MRLACRKLQEQKLNIVRRIFLASLRGSSGNQGRSMYFNMKMKNERCDNGDEVMFMDSEGHVDDSAININLIPIHYIRWFCRKREVVESTTAVVSQQIYPAGKIVNP